MSLRPRLADDRAFRRRWGLEDDDPGPIPLPKMLFQAGLARGLEAERDTADGYSHSGDEIGGQDGSEMLRGGSDNDTLEHNDPIVVMIDGVPRHRKTGKLVVDVSARSPSPRLETEAARSNRVAKPIMSTVPADERWLLVDGKYRLNPNFNPRFNPTLEQAIAVPAILGAALGSAPVWVPPLAGALAVGGPKAGSALKAAERFRQTYQPKIAEFFSEALPETAMGEHVIPRRWGRKFPFLEPIIESRFNNLRRPTRGEMHELHYKCDNYFNGVRLPKGLEERGWSGLRAGLEKYGPLRWLWECTTPAMKAAAGAVGAAAGLGVREARSKEEGPDRPRH